MKFVLLAMLAMIGGSVVLEMIVPQAIKNRLGAAICWGMMAFTMTFLGIATLGLLYTTYAWFVRPLIAS